MKLTVGKKIAIPLFGLIGLVGVVSLVVQTINVKVSESAATVKEVEVPKAILTLSMLDRLGSMNSSVLEYASGEVDEREAFSENYEQFQKFLADFRAIVGEQDESAQLLESNIALFFP